jgi:hypothetical protein
MPKGAVFGATVTEGENGRESVRESERETARTQADHSPRLTKEHDLDHD